MIYLGKYYQDMGFTNSLIIPRYTSADASEYRIIMINNVDKTTIINDTTIDDNIEQNSDSPFYYKFDSVNLTGIKDGEYTVTLFTDDELVFSGLMTFRDKKPGNASVYNTSSGYIVYG